MQYFAFQYLHSFSTRSNISTVCIEWPPATTAWVEVPSDFVASPHPWRYRAVFMSGSTYQFAELKSYMRTVWIDDLKNKIQSEGNQFGKHTIFFKEKCWLLKIKHCGDVHFDRSKFLSYFFLTFCEVHFGTWLYESHFMLSNFYLQISPMKIFKELSYEI